MSRSRDDRRSGGIDFFGLLQVAFIIMKVAGIIEWSWWLVFIPFWIALGLVILGIILGALSDL